MAFRLAAFSAPEFGATAKFEGDRNGHNLIVRTDFFCSVHPHPDGHRCTAIDFTAPSVVDSFGDHSGYVIVGAVRIGCSGEFTLVRLDSLTVRVAAAGADQASLGVTVGRRGEAAVSQLSVPTPIYPAPSANWLTRCGSILLRSRSTTSG